MTKLYDFPNYPRYYFAIFNSILIFKLAEVPHESNLISIFLGFDLQQPIDIKTAMGRSGQKTFTILAKFDDGQYVNQCMEMLSTEFVKQDWNGVFTATDMLKQACEMIGAGRAYYACYYLK